MNLEARGYSSLPACELAHLCQTAYNGISAKLKEKVERNRAAARWQWENRSRLMRFLCWLFREPIPDFNNDVWILDHTTLHPNGGLHGVLLRSYRWEERRALKEMLALCKTVSITTPVWFSSESAVMLQDLLSQEASDAAGSANA